MLRRLRLLLPARTSAASSFDAFNSVRAINLPAACTELPHVNCWKCEKLLDCVKEKFFCTSCDAIQPPVKCVNYFQYLNIPLKFDVDIGALQNTYKLLQGKLHPDRFAQRSTPEKTYSEQQSSVVNLAYKTLLQPLDRANYLLSMVGLKTGEETSALNAQFLMEMLELNEAVEDTDDVDELQRMGENAKKELDRCQQSFAQLFDNDKLNEAKAVADEMRYYLRIKTNVDKKLGFA